MRLIAIAVVAVAFKPVAAPQCTLVTLPVSGRTCHSPVYWMPPPSHQVFDDNKTFSSWFGEFLDSQEADDDAAAVVGSEGWLKSEKRLVVIHRLHQILEPFMLRRQVGEGSGSEV